MAMRRPSLPRPSSGVDRLHRAIDADRIIAVVALHRVVGERQIQGTTGKGADMIEARHERKGVGAREPAVGRLQAENSAQRGRHAY